MDSGALAYDGRAKVIVVANQKGGCGKTTVAINLAVGLARAGVSVASVDADLRQESLSHYLENRAAWARLRGIDLPTPSHERLDISSIDEAGHVVASRISDLSAKHQAIVIDTAGHDDVLSRSVHAQADVLVTPVNDSFVDLDVLGMFAPETLDIVRVGRYGRMVQELRAHRRRSGECDVDWIVVRNRLSALNTHNKKHVAESLLGLSQLLNFRCADGIGERLIFREFFTKGLTAADDLTQASLGVRPTMSHLTAQLEVQGLMQEVLRLSSLVSNLSDETRTAA